MTLETKTIKPGMLVSFNTTVRGNTRYDKRVIEAETLIGNGTRSQWQTTRTVADAEEQKLAIQVRGQARSAIIGVCSWSYAGYLCPEDRLGELEAACKEADRLVAEFNRNARITRIGVHVLCGRIAEDDTVAIRKINAELRGLIEDMQTGIRDLDRDAIREAATRAKNMSRMLTDDAAARTTDAIKAARAIANKISEEMARVAKDGGAVAVKIDQASLDILAGARTAFLDVDTPIGEIEASQVAARVLDVPDQDPDAEQNLINPEGVSVISQEERADYDDSVEIPPTVAAPDVPVRSFSFDF